MIGPCAEAASWLDYVRQWSPTDSFQRLAEVCKVYVCRQITFSRVLEDIDDLVVTESLAR